MDTISAALRALLLGAGLLAFPAHGAAPGGEDGKAPLRFSIRMEGEDTPPLAGLFFTLRLPIGTRVPTQEGSTAVKETALACVAGTGASLLVSGNFIEAEGTLAIAMAGAFPRQGDILALSAENGAGEPLTKEEVQMVNQGLVVQRAMGVDTGEYRSVDLTNRVQVQVRVQKARRRIGVPNP